MAHETQVLDYFRDQRYIQITVLDGAFRTYHSFAYNGQGFYRTDQPHQALPRIQIPRGPLNPAGPPLIPFTSAILGQMPLNSRWVYDEGITREDSSHIGQDSCGYLVPAHTLGFTLKGFVDLERTMRVGEWKCYCRDAVLRISLMQIPAILGNSAARPTRSTQRNSSGNRSSPSSTLHHTNGPRVPRYQSPGAAGGSPQSRKGLIARFSRIYSQHNLASTAVHVTVSRHVHSIQPETALERSEFLRWLRAIRQPATSSSQICRKRRQAIFDAEWHAKPVWALAGCITGVRTAIRYVYTASRSLLYTEAIPLYTGNKLPAPLRAILPPNCKVVNPPLWNCQISPGR